MAREINFNGDNFKCEGVNKWENAWGNGRGIASGIIQDYFYIKGDLPVRFLKEAPRSVISEIKLKF